MKPVILRSLVAVTVLAGGIGSATVWSEDAAHYAAAVRVTPLLKTTTTSSGKPLEYLKTDHPEAQALIVEIPPGTETGWHLHPVPAYAYILSGSVRVTVRDGDSRVFKAGEAFAEMKDQWHNGYNEGSEPVRILMFVTGQTGTAFTVRE